MTRSSVALTGALVASVAGLAACALTRLGDARDPRDPSVLGDLLGGPVVGFMLTSAFWLAVGALLLVIATAIMSLVSGASGKPSPGSTDALPAASSVPPVERTDPSDDERWIGLAEGCVEVVDELDEIAEDSDSPCRELAEHVVARLERVLERSGVEVIANDTKFERARHRPVPGDCMTATGDAVLETLSPGFAVGRRVLRRARVRVE